MSTGFAQFLEELGESGILLRVEGGTLRRMVPAGVKLSPTARHSFKVHRQALIDYCTPKHRHITKRWVTRARLSLSFYDEENDDDAHTGLLAADGIMQIAIPTEARVYLIAFK